MPASPFLRFVAASACGLVDTLRHVFGRERAAPLAPYHCVSIRPCATPCALARQLSERRFLPGDAPALPLPGCVQTASCTYAHHADRRHHDRRADFGCGVQPLLRTRIERRRATGRRATDPAVDSFRLRA